MTKLFDLLDDDSARDIAKDTIKRWNNQPKSE